MSEQVRIEMIDSEGATINTFNDEKAAFQVLLREVREDPSAKDELALIYSPRSFRKGVIQGIMGYEDIIKLQAEEDLGI